MDEANFDKKLPHNRVACQLPSVESKAFAFKINSVKVKG